MRMSRSGPYDATYVRGKDLQPVEVAHVDALLGGWEPQQAPNVSINGAGF